jgi:hypothetical protein
MTQNYPTQRKENQFLSVKGREFLAGIVSTLEILAVLGVDNWAS